MSADVESVDPHTGAPGRSDRAAAAAPLVSTRPTAGHPRRGVPPAAVPAATISDRRIWRCSRPVRWAVVAVMIVVGVALPAAAVATAITGASGFGGAPVPVFTIIGAAAATVLIFGWRLGLHPRLVLEGDRVTIINPFRRRVFELGEVTVIVPGGDGLRVATPRGAMDAWCVQKSGRAMASGRPTRADRIAAVLWSAWDAAHPVRSRPGAPAQLRFARPDDHDPVAGLVRSVCSADTMTGPGDAEDLRGQVPTALSDPARQTLIAEVAGHPVGWAQYGWSEDGSARIRSFGVIADQRRRGIGGLLLNTVETEIFADRGVTRVSVQLPADQRDVEQFLTARGWCAQEGDRVSAPTVITLTRQNPHRPRRGR